MDPSSTALCTITTASYQRQAACMLESYLRQHPGGRGYVLHVDDMEPEPALDRPDIVRLALAELGLPDLNAMRARYTLFELCNALKPFLLSHLLATKAHDRLCYADGDLYFFASLQAEVWDKLETSSILLTPHLCRLPAEDPDLIWRDLAVLQHGVYNGGFIAVRRHPEAIGFLSWWGERTRRLGQKKLEEGLNCDQRWLDLLPGFDLKLYVSRHPGLNAAYWNLHERTFAPAGPGFSANGQPLIFYHFSGYDPERPNAITRHFTHFTFESRPDVRPLFETYRAALQATGTPPPPAGDAPEPRVPGHAAEAAAAPSGSGTRVSVIIPAYNAERHLAAAIDSVLVQTLEAVEIIVVDDGSTDNTAAVASAYGDRVRVLRQAHAGVSVARNLGIGAAQGDAVAFLDADDWYIHPDKLARQAAILSTRPDIGIVHSGWRLVDEQGHGTVERTPWRQAPVLNLQGWLLWQPALPSAMMMRREAVLAVGGFDPGLAHVEDLDLALRLSLAGYETAWWPEIAVAYRQHEHNATRRLEASERDFDAVLDKFLARSDAPPAVRALAPRVRFGMRLWLALQYFRAHAYADMARILRSTLPYSPETSPAATVLAWLRGFESTLAGEYGERFDAFSLTSRPEWQALVGELVIGERPRQAIETGARQARARLADLAPVRRARQAEPTPAAWVMPATSPRAPAAPKLNLAGALLRDFGKHRSGWTYGLRSLAPLQREDGVWVDAFVEHYFGNAEPLALRPYDQPWIGFLHNPPHMPDWFVRHQAPQSLLANVAFRESLSACLGMFCLSETLARWWRQQLDVPIEVLALPTITPDRTFSLEAFVRNPQQRVVQVGSWLRKLNSIYFLPVRRLQRSIVHQHMPYIDDLIAREREVYGLHVDEAAVEVLPFLDNERYDELLSQNLIYMELYDSSANNVVVECLARATPLLVNPLPAVVEYLGRDYPFYFTSRPQAAAKAEDMMLIEAAHHYLAAHPFRHLLSGEAFAAALAGSSIYRGLPG